MSRKTLYFKLGASASSFNDPKSGLNIANQEVAAIDANVAKQSKAVAAAKANGHIVEVDEDEYSAKGAIKAPVASETEAARKALEAQTSKPDPGDANLVKKGGGNVSPSGGVPGVGGTTGDGGTTELVDESELDEDEDEDEEDDDDEKTSEERAAERKARADKKAQRTEARDTKKADKKAAKKK